MLWDTSCVLQYYVQEAATSAKAAERVSMLVQSVRHHRADVHFFIPNMVVAEVFCALARYCYSSFDNQINKKFGGKNRTLDMRRYKTARAKFGADIHNGALFYQYELNRYHILALDLIAPIDKYRKYYRKGNVRTMGTYDLVIGAMAMHLARVHGRDRCALLTCDRRMEAIFDRAANSLVPSTVKYLGLDVAAQEFGFGDWSADLYPQVLDIARCSEGELRAFFGRWPLPTRKLRNRVPRA